MRISWSGSRPRKSRAFHLDRQEVDEAWLALQCLSCSRSERSYMSDRLRGGVIASSSASYYSRQRDGLNFGRCASALTNLSKRDAIMTLRNIRELKAAQQGGRCYYCGHPTWAAGPQRFARKHGLTARQVLWFTQTAEHRIALCEGGTNAADNVVMACYYCNSRRHRCRKPLSPSEYRERVQKRLDQGRWHGVVFRA